MKRDDIAEKLIGDNSKIPGEIKYTKKEMEDLNEEYGKAIIRVNNRIYKKNQAIFKRSNII